MLSTKLCGALLCAAALAPMTAGSCPADAHVTVTPLGMAIAEQGNQALRDIRDEARLALRELRPAPIEDMLVLVRREAAPQVVSLEI